MIKRITLLAGLCTSLGSNGQEYPRDYFRNPMNIRMELVANFGEIRTNHWHMGLDIRTQQRENLPVHAAAEGYISRVVVEPGGFGQAIYIAHPNGLTTLYAHMNAFYPALEQWVKEQQYARENWHVSLTLPANRFTVKKGDFIGLSGNTGGSQGPHVHFEIRNTATEACRNPLLFNFPIADAVPPAVSRLAMYDRNRSTYLQSPQLLALKRSGGDYVPASSRLRVGTNRVSFAVGAVDRFSQSTNPNGIYSARMIVDGRPVSAFILDNISYDDTRYMNAQVDFPYQARGGGALQHITPLPGAMKVAYEAAGDGVLELQDMEPHDVVIEVLDAARNTSRIRFSIQYDPALAPAATPRPAQLFLPNAVNIFEREDFECYTSEAAMYDSAAVNFTRTASTAAGAISPVYSILPASIPVHDSVTVRIRPSATLSLEELDRVVIQNKVGSRTYLQKARLQNGWLMARFRQFGTYQAFLDTTPPVIPAVPASLGAATRIVITPTDQFKSISSFRATLNGKWLRFSNDKGRSWIYRFDEHFPRGTHELVIEVTDEAGNRSERRLTVRR